MIHKLSKTVPVGIKPQPVWILSIAGILLCVFHAVTSFCSGLYRYLNKISTYYPETGERVFYDYGKMEKYSLCLGDGFFLFRPYFLCLLMFAVFCIVYHYIGAKSVYTMKRLKNPLELYVRCYFVPLVFIAAGVISVYAMNYIFIEIYLSFIPEENLLSLWAEDAWRVWK